MRGYVSGCDGDCGNCPECTACSWCKGIVAREKAGLGAMEPLVQTRPQEAPRGDDWMRLLATAREVVPTVVETLPGAYQVYGASGEGVRGSLAVLDSIGNDPVIRAIPARAQPAMPKLASQQHAADAAQAGEGDSSFAKSVGVILTASGVIWVASKLWNGKRKK